MNQTQFNHLLRNAVIAALPLAGATSCVATETKPEKATEIKEVAKVADPCRSGKTSKKSAKQNYSAQIALQKTPLSAKQCLALCKTTFEEQRIGNTSDLVKLESFAASHCKTVNRSFSSSVFGGQNPTPSTLLSCDIEYTALHSPYTCARPVPGRLPNGLHLTDTQSSPNVLGQYLADMTAMETAAITAFYYLSRELEAYNAPAELITRARKAMLEETRHSEMAALLAASFDAEMPEVSVDDFCLRSLYEIALENAVEGCVNETFAAACGLWQSEHAQLGVFRQVIGHITEEEMGHASLSWDIHQWIMPQLSEAEQEQVRIAQAEAVESLVDEFKQESNPVVQQAFGLPSKDDAARLFTQLKESVWAVARMPIVEQAQA
ncbi:MAG: hypothetical protein ACPG47_08190 [Leucothrix sp.]